MTNSATTVTTKKPGEPRTPRVTPKRQQYLRAINQYIAEHNYPPTWRTIGELVGVSSSSTVQQQLNSLRKLGLVDWEDEKPRTLRLLPGASEWIGGASDGRQADDGGSDTRTRRADAQEGR